MRATIAALFLCIPLVAGAEPIEALKPMAFLAGHCWKGAFPDARQTDEHCFTWLYSGKALWTRVGDDAYEAWSEAQGKDGWATMFKVLLKRAPPKS